METDGLCTLVRRVKSGDRDAQQELFRRVRPLLSAMAQRFNLNWSPMESVSDFEQDARLRIWTRLEQFDGGDTDEATAAALHDWTEQLVRRLAINRGQFHTAERRNVNRRTRQPRDPDSLFSVSGTATPEFEGSGRTASSIVAKDELDEVLRRAVEGIPNPTDKQIVQMCFFEAKSLRTVAAALGLSYDGVRTRYHATLRHLERRLKGIV